MKRESKPDGHYGSKASGTEETAGRCYKLKIPNHEIHVESKKYSTNNKTMKNIP